MFGCGQVRVYSAFSFPADSSQYPAYDSFLSLVKEEAVQNVKRIRNHPSIVIFGVHFISMSDPPNLAIVHSR